MKTTPKRLITLLPKRTFDIYLYNVKHIDKGGGGIFFPSLHLFFLHLCAKHTWLLKGMGTYMIVCYAQNTPMIERETKNNPFEPCAW